jgi:hypothetical protein
MMNIFQIWASIGETVPFAARRANWPPQYYVVVEEVEISYFPYGVACGYPTIKGERNDHFGYDSAWQTRQAIPNAGSYQWSFVPTHEIDGKLISIEVDEQELYELGLAGHDLSYLDMEPAPVAAPDTRYPGYRRTDEEEVEWFEQPVLLGTRTDVPGDCRVIALGITDRLEERTTSALIVGVEGSLNDLVTLARAENILGWRIARADDVAGELDGRGITPG